MPSHVIYTAGYSAWPSAGALDAKVAELGAMLIDTRYVPWSRNPAYTRDALAKALGPAYLWCQALGNTAYKDGGPIQLADPEGALPVLAPILAERPVILLCQCVDVQQCHRKVAAEFIAERLGGEVVHLEPPARNAGASILGLTLKRPWPWLICDPDEVLGRARKPVENRTWKPAAHHIGSYIAIHAGQGWDKDAIPWITKTLRDAWGHEHLGIADKVGHPAGVIVGVAKLVGVAHQEEPGGEVSIVLGEGDALSVAADPWFVGPYGWLLDGITPIKPVECNGMLGLWALPDDVLGDVRAAYAAARRARMKVSA
jgi:hypothetical protein